MEQTVIKDDAIKFCSILPELFSDDFDRKTLWERIGNGIYSSVRKCGGDYESFINYVLEYIKADPGKVASCKRLNSFLSGISVKPKEWKDEFLNVFSKKHHIVLVYARDVWELNKKKGGAE